MVILDKKFVLKCIRHSGLRQFFHQGQDGYLYVFGQKIMFTEKYHATDMDICPL